MHAGGGSAFTFPCVNRIMENLKDTGGGVMFSLDVLI